MSVKHHQNDKPSRSWLYPFAMGLVAGSAITFGVTASMPNETEEPVATTMAHSALEAGPAQGRTAPERAAPAAPQPTAAEPVAAAAEPAAAVEPAAAPTPAPQPPAAVEAPKPAAAPAPAPKVAEPVAAAPRAPLPAAAPAAPAPVAAPAAPSVPAVPVDPNSQDAKLAAAAQVRLKGDTKIDNMLDDALTGEKKAAPAAVAPPTLAQTPSREDVVNTMSVLVPAIRGCAQGQSGLAPMSIVVLSDGRVESAALSSGPFQGTASGRCMEGVVRRARFPHFKQANFRVQFPFAVQ